MKGRESNGERDGGREGGRKEKYKGRNEERMRNKEYVENR